MLSEIFVLVLLGCKVQSTEYKICNHNFVTMSDPTPQKFRTYALTLRPLNGVTDSTISNVTKWIKKRSTHYHIVTEKTGSERHIHAALYLKTDVTKVNFRNVWIRLCKAEGLTDQEITVARKGVKILYSNDFIDNYLDKDDDTEVVESCLPEMKSLEQYYPPKPVERSGTKRKCSAYYYELEELWHKHKRPLLEVNSENCRHFLFNMMYNERCINVIRDDKTIIQTARHLTRWLNKADESTIELAPFEKEE